MENVGETGQWKKENGLGIEGLRGMTSKTWEERLDWRKVNRRTLEMEMVVEGLWEGGTQREKSR